MPAKATIYNCKTEAVFDFGTGPRNFGYYNPQGSNILYSHDVDHMVWNKHYFVADSPCGLLKHSS